MAVAHSTLAKNAATNAVTGLIGTSGFLVFRTAGTLGSGTALATLALGATAFYSAANGTAEAYPITQDSNAAGGGDIATATLQKADGTVILQCSVTATGGGGDITLSGGLTIGSGDVVSCSSLTYTALSQ